MVPAGTGVIDLEFFQKISTTIGPVKFGITLGLYSGLSSSDAPVDTSNLTVILCYRYGPQTSYYGYVPLDVTSLGGGNFYAEGIVSEGAFNVTHIYVCADEPLIGAYGISSLQNVDSSGFGGPIRFLFSTLRFGVISSEEASSNQTQQYQNSVTSGISKVKDTVQKGFDKVTAAVKGVGSSVSGAVDAVGEKVTELKQSVVEKTTEIKESIIEKTDEVKETITQETEKLGNFLLDGIKDLFLPSETYFSELFDRLNEFFAERFGFLYFPIEHFISLCNKLLNLPETAPSIAIPELAYEGQVLIPAQTYTFDFLSQEPFKTVHDYYLLAIDAALISAFVALLHKKYNEVMAN